MVEVKIHHQTTNPEKNLTTEAGEFVTLTLLLVQRCSCTTKSDYKNTGGFLKSNFASLNKLEVLRMLSKKLLFPPIGTQ